MVEATDGRICGAENVPVMRFDYAAVEGGMHGVRKSFQYR